MPVRMHNVGDLLSGVTAACSGTHSHASQSVAAGVTKYRLHDDA